MGTSTTVGSSNGSITDLQKATAEAIISVFETGDYDTSCYYGLTDSLGDPGGLSYGKGNCSLNSGNLYLLIAAYVAANGQYSQAFTPDMLENLKNMDSCVVTKSFKHLLKQASTDPIMWDVQDKFFDAAFWQPAAKWIDNWRFDKPLPIVYALVYDSHIQGGFANTLKLNEYNGKDAKVWAKAYALARKSYLRSSTNSLVRTTQTRPITFLGLIATGNFDLNLPITVSGKTLTAANFEAISEKIANAKQNKQSQQGQLDLDYDTHTDADIFNNPASVSAPVDRILYLKNPPMHGEDVEYVQTQLNYLKCKLHVDGVFGSSTDAAIKIFQKSQGLVVDGIVGPATRAALSFVFVS